MALPPSRDGRGAEGRSGITQLIPSPRRGGPSFIIRFSHPKEIACYKGAIMSAKRIGILTGGGDVPGLNSVIKSVVYRGSEMGCEVIGIRRGWEGLTHVDLREPAS